MKIKTFLSEKNLTAKWLSEYLAVNQSTVQKWKNQDRQIKDCGDCYAVVEQKYTINKSDIGD